MFELHKVKQLPSDLEWLPGDQQEAKDVFGWEIDKLLDDDALDSFYVTYEDTILSVMQMDEDGNLTYFTTVHILDVPIRTYIKFVKEKLDLYVRLVGYELATMVAKDYKEGIFTLKALGFEMIYESRRSFTYGYKKEDS